MPKFNRRLAVIALSLALGVPAAVRAEDLMQVYREAQQYDPVLASARASWNATQERVPQARAGLLPSVGLTGAANHNDGRTTIKGDQRTRHRQLLPELELLDLRVAAAVPHAEHRSRSTRRSSRSRRPITSSGSRSRT